MKINLKHISLEIEGTSHSEFIKLIIRGIKKGTKVNEEYIKEMLKRRNPGAFFNSPRKEADEYIIKKGIKNGKIISNKIIVVFKNNNINKKSYTEHDGFLRPSHSDYAQYLKKGCIETGAGEYSGRMTLPLAFAGAIAKYVLEDQGTIILSKIETIGSFKDEKIKETLEEYKKLDRLFPLKDSVNALDTLKSIKEDRDTVGGILKTIVFNAPSGLGGSLQEGMESKISSLIYAIPSVKGVEFGDGFNITKKKGSEVQDSFCIKNNKIGTKENHNGGILGGVTTGENLIIRTAFKPIPTHGKEMFSLNIKTLKEEHIVFGGNHDVFSVNRAIPSLEGIVALVILDEIYEKN